MLSVPLTFPTEILWQASHLISFGRADVIKRLNVDCTGNGIVHNLLLVC